MESTKAEDLKALSIIAYALMAGLVLFCGVVIFLNQGQNTPAQDSIFSPTMDLVGVGFFALMCASMSRFLSGKLLEQTPREKRQDYPQAMGAYRSAVIMRLALLEGPGLMATVFAMVTGNMQLLIVSLAMLALMYLARPQDAEFVEWQG